MIVMSCLAQLYIGDSRSLKDKRQVINSLKERIHNQFNASVAEIDDQKLWERSSLGVACDQILSKVVNFIEADHRVQLLDFHTEVH